MRKIMLVMDDFQDLVSMENLLRRLGFDVLSLGKEVLVNDALLRFTPDLVIASFNSRGVDGLRIAQRLKRSIATVRIALTYGANTPPVLTVEAQSLVDALISLPVQPTTVIKVVSQLLNVESAPLVAKYQKLTANRMMDPLSAAIGGGDGSTGNVEVKGDATLGRTAEWVRSALDPDGDRTERSERYDQFLEKNNPEPALGVLPRDRMNLASKKLKKSAESDAASMAEINAEKKAFLEAMFDPNDPKNKKG